MNTSSRRHSNPSAEGSAVALSSSQAVPAEWRWHHRTLLALRTRLSLAHADHVKQAVAPLETDSNDPADTAQEQVDRDVLWAELGANDDQLVEIDAALARIRNGTYGRCEITHDAIPAARLRALPWTRFCHEAAQRLEAERRVSRQA